MARRPPTSALRPPGDTRRGNRILAALPRGEYQRIGEHLETIPLVPKMSVYQEGHAIRHVYFPIDGVFSMTTVLSTGSLVEAATIGNEGMVGIEAYFRDGSRANGNTMLQVPGTYAERLEAVIFRQQLRDNPAFQQLVGRYADYVLRQLMQSTACNAVHSVQERCCRWLLMTRDRVQSDQFMLSHEFLAVMLAVRRQSVSLVASTLREAGLIQYRHSRITILDGERLEAASCECYGVLKNRLDGVLRTANHLPSRPDSGPLS